MASASAVATSATSTGSILSLQHAGLDPRHVEQIGDERVEPIRLRVDRLEHLATLLVRPRDIGVHQIRHGCLDRSQWTAQVVRDGRQHAAADLIGLFEDLGIRRGAQEAISFEHQSELIADRADHAALGGLERPPFPDEHDQTEVPVPHAEGQSLGGAPG